MKTFTVALLAVMLALVAAEPSTDNTVAGAPNTCEYAGEDEESWAQAFVCLGHDKNFNGRRTCQVGCRLACAQPGCGGYKDCEQIPNPGEKPTTYLHKYKCKCQSG